MAHRQIGTRRAEIIVDERNPNKTSPKYDRILVRCENLTKRIISKVSDLCSKLLITQCVPFGSMA